MKKKIFHRRVLKRTVVIVIVIGLLISIFGYISGINKEIDLLVKRTYKQDVRIEQLELDNKQLEKAIAYQYQLIKESNKSTTIEKTIIHSEQKQNEKQPLDEVINPTHVIMITLVSVGKAITSLFNNISWE